MKRWLIAAALACGLNAEAQPLKGGLLGRSPSAPGTVYAPATDTTTATGTIVARNVTATALATPGAITVTPVLTQTGTINVVSGALLADGDYFTVEYEAGLTIPIEFDATPGNGTTGGRIPFVFAPGDSAGTIRDGLITLLGAAAPTKVTAAIGGAAAITVTMVTPGVAGGVITENVTDAGFTVAGFADPTHATTVTYKLVAKLPDGTTTEAGAASSTAASVATLTAANFNRLSWSAVTGASSYAVYRTVAPTSPATTGVIYTGTALTVDDVALAGGGETAPTVDSTGLLRGDGLRIGTSATPGNVLTADANGYFTAQAGGGSPGGANTQVQFNNAGAFAGDAGLTYDSGAKTLSVVAGGGAGIVVSDNVFATYDVLVKDAAGSLRLNAAAPIKWHATGYNGVSDSGLRRVSPGLVGATSGGSNLGSLQAGNLTAVALGTPTVTSPLTVNGTPGVTTYGYKAVAFLNDGTSSAASPEVTIATGPAALNSTDSITVAVPAVTNMAYMNVYRTTGGAAPPKLIYSGTSPFCIDTGAEISASTPATRNTTGYAIAARAKITGLESYANNAAALAGGLVAGDLYTITGSDPLALAVTY